MQFPTNNLSDPAPGMVRDYFFFEASWFKDITGNWGFGFDFTVDPMPFHNMTGFPYPLDESYPFDAAHLSYLQDWNTRRIDLPANPHNTVSSQNGFPIIAFRTVTFAAATIYVGFKLGAFLAFSPDFLTMTILKRSQKNFLLLLSSIISSASPLVSLISQPCLASAT